MDRIGASDQFEREGYVVFERALEGPLLEILRDECSRFTAREDARLDALGRDVDGITHRGKRYFAGECQRVQPRLREVLFSQVMAEVCRATLGPDAYFYFDQYVVKGAEDGLPFGWHQDSGYFVVNGGAADHRPYLTCWCPLDDVGADNGTVVLQPFSRIPETRDRVLPHHRQAGTNDLIGWTGSDEGVTVAVPAGSVVAFSSRLLHATGPNRTSSLRRAYLAQFSAEVILQPGTPHLRRNAIPLLRDGKQVTFG